MKKRHSIPRTILLALIALTLLGGGVLTGLHLAGIPVPFVEERGLLLFWPVISLLTFLLLPALLRGATEESKTSEESVEGTRDDETVTYALDLLHAPVMLVNSDLEILFFNRHAERITGYSRQEVQGSPFLELMSLPPGDEGVMESLWSTDRKSYLTFHKTGTRGEPRLIRWTGAEVRDRQGLYLYTIMTGVDITEIRKKEIHERLFSTAVESNGEAILISDLDGNLEYANPAFETITGYTRQESLGRPLDQLLSRADSFDSVKRQLEELRILRKSDTLSRKDGSMIQCESTFASVSDLEGKPVNYVAVIRDVTERNRSEKKLRESQEKYRSLIEEVLSGIFILQDGVIRYSNRALLQLLGYSESEFLNKKFDEIIAPEDITWVLDRYAEKSAFEHFSEEQEFRLLHRDGETRVYVNMKIGNTFYENSPAFIVSVKDVTEQKRREREREKHLQEIKEHGIYTNSIIDLAPVGIWITDFIPLKKEEILNDPLYDWHMRAGVRVVTRRVNRSLTNILGYGEEELLGSSLFDPRMTDDENREIYLGQVLSRLKGDRGSYEIHLKKKGGGTVPLMVEAIPLLFDPVTGLASQSVAMVIDLTERKLAEGRIRKAQEELQKTVQELYESNRKLEESYKKLETLSATDAMTGISNRRRFDDFLLHEWRRALRNASPISVVLVDIDFFKMYNDHYGHQAGDAILAKVAGVLKGIMKRSTDLLARYGGEEFIVVLPDTPLEGAGILAERLREAVDQARFPHAASSCCDHVTVSLGVSSLVPRRGLDEKIMVKLADQALYRSKELGRNRVYLWEESSTEA